jgi:putative DNA primase/helicase
VGENHELRRFKVWGAKALAGIALKKHVSDATMSRGVRINMRRKMRHESVKRLRHAESGLFEPIVSKLARFANDYSQQLKMARPVLPEALSDRAQDNWELLLAIAGCAGSKWEQWAIAAAL